MNTIDDKQNEMDFVYHCNEFEYNHEFQLQTYTLNFKKVVSFN